MFFILAFTFAAFSYIVYRLVGNRVTGETRARIEERRDQREREYDTIKDKCREATDELTKLSHVELLLRLHAGELKPIDVLRSFQVAALKAQDDTNCITAFFSDADQMAIDLEGKNPTDYPLYGLPFSVKESVSIEGCDVTLGYAKSIGNLSSSTSPIVEALMEAGAIPFVRTNVPQSLLSYQCGNPIYGTTTNPYNSERTSGGSSGGCAALVAQGGCVFGYGGDAAGSLRIPASFCGVFTMKPTRSRICQVGQACSVPGRPMIAASGGILAKEMYILETCNRVIIDAAPHHREVDPYIVPLTWTVFTPRKLTIGVMEEDPYMPVCASVKRAVAMASKCLDNQGHTIVSVRLPDLRHIFHLYASAATVDGGEYLLRRLEGEPIDEAHKKFVRLLGLPQIVRFNRWVTVMLQIRRHASILYGKRIHDMAMALPRTSGDLRVVYEQLDLLRSTIGEMWKENSLDVLLMPAVASVALRHADCMNVPSAAVYSGLFNLVDYPAGVVPITKVTKLDIEEPYDVTRSDQWSTLMRENNCTRETIGLPVGVQIVAQHLQEEKCLYAMQMLNEAM